VEEPGARGAIRTPNLRPSAFEFGRLVVRIGMVRLQEHQAVNLPLFAARASLILAKEWRAMEAPNS
jgi:hypothetical protein